MSEASYLRRPPCSSQTLFWLEVHGLQIRRLVHRVHDRVLQLRNGEGRMLGQDEGGDPGRVWSRHRGPVPRLPGRAGDRARDVDAWGRNVDRVMAPVREGALPLREAQRVALRLVAVLVVVVARPHREDGRKRVGSRIVALEVIGGEQRRVVVPEVPAIDIVDVTVQVVVDAIALDLTRIRPELAGET